MGSDSARIWKAWRKSKCAGSCWWLSKHYFALWIKVLAAAEEWCHTGNAVFLMSCTKEIWTTYNYLEGPISTSPKNDNFWCSGQNPVYILPAYTVSCFKGIFYKNCVTCCWRLSWWGVSHFCGIGLISILHISAYTVNRSYNP